MYVDVNGSYNLSVLELMNFEPTAMVYLEDRSRGTFTNLREVQALTYNLTKGYVNNRFFLHFSAPLSTQTTAESCNRNDGKVTVINPGASVWNISLQASTGEVVGSASAVSTDYEFTGLAAGNYTVKYETESGYVAYQQVAVEAGQNLNTGFAASTQVASSGSEVEFTAELNAANTTYVWNFGDQTAVNAGAVVQHTYDAPGIYTVSLSLTSGGCTSVTEHSISVLTATGIANTDGEKAFKLYPNPATDLISIQLSDASKFAPQWIEIQDAAGRTISREIAKDMTANGRKTLDVSTLANGVYQIVLSTKDARFVRSFVVAH
jgi:PKD repeat protein